MKTYNREKVLNKKYPFLPLEFAIKENRRLLKIVITYRHAIKAAIDNPDAALGLIKNALAFDEISHKRGERP